MAYSGRTYLQIVNAVLEKLREPTAASGTANTYVTLIARIVDDVKTEVENAHHWRDLRNTYTVTAVSGTTAYTFTGSGPTAQIMDAWNLTTPKELCLGTFSDFNKKFFGVTTVATGATSQYLPAGLDSSYDLQVDIWPSPSSTNSLRFNLYTPQAQLTPSTSDATVIIAPNDVIIAGAYARALAERGDDSGTAVQQAEGFYQRQLADAVAIEGGYDPSEVDWDAD